MGAVKRRKAERSKGPSFRNERSKQIGKSTVALEKEVFDSNAGYHNTLDLAIVWCTSMAVYLATLYPTIAGGDSGELVAESCHLGISHPPGYPLFNILIYAVVSMKLPPWIEASPAWRANAVAAACDATASALIYATIRIWTYKLPQQQSRFGSMTAALLFSFSPLIWTYAVGAEVFSLNNLFVAILMYILLRYAVSGGKWKYACWGAFFSGLAMCNQHTVILLEIPVVCWVLWTQRTVLSRQKFFTLSALYFAGLTPYLYMPIAATLNSQPGSWGEVTTPSGFFHHLRRGDYGSFRLFASAEETEGLLTRLYFYITDLTMRETLYVGAPIALIGATLTCSKSFISNEIFSGTKYYATANATDRVGVLVAFAFMFYMLVFHSLSNLPLGEGLLYGVHMRFWQQPNIIVFIWLGVGLSSIMTTILKLSVFNTHWSVSSSLQVLLSSALVIAQITRWYHYTDQSQSSYIAQYAKALVDPLPIGSLYFANYDLQWTSVRYLQRCEGFRTDVTVINLSMMTYRWFQHKHVHYPEMMFPGSHLVPTGSKSGGFTFKQLVDANYETFKNRGIYLGGKLSYPDPDFSKSYVSLPVGIMNQFVRLEDEPVFDEWYWRYHHMKSEVDRALRILPAYPKYDEQTWEYAVARDYHMNQVESANYLLDKVLEGNKSLSLLVEAAAPLEYSLTYEPKEFYSDYLLKNLGLAYANMVKSNEEFSATEKDLFPDHAGSPKQDFKDRASNRMLEVWHKWLKTNSAPRDPAYETIKAIVTKFIT